MKIVDNLLVLPIYIQPAFKSISTVSHNNPIWQTIPSIHYSVSKIKIVLGLGIGFGIGNLKIFDRWRCRHSGRFRPLDACNANLHSNPIHSADQQLQYQQIHNSIITRNISCISTYRPRFWLASCFIRKKCFFQSFFAIMIVY